MRHAKRNLHVPLLHRTCPNQMCLLPKERLGLAEEGRATGTSFLLATLCEPMECSKARRPSTVRMRVCMLIGSQATRYVSGHNPSTPPAARKGSANWRWSGGPKRPQLSPEHRVWRHEVFTRDNYTCQNCGARSGAGNAVYLQAHHIRRVADDPFSAYDVDNGKTLCLDCHRNHHWGADRKRRRTAARELAAH
jgi:hypothetical protein